MTTFISYSRRQLYFAESLALHLQKEGVEVWFDLQQLHAGRVWSEGLKDGIDKAGQLVLLVSKASLDSPHCQDEWKGVAERGNQIVLVIYEPVDLPAELSRLAVYDFRSDFEKNVRDLAAFLKGEAKPRYDHVPPPNRLDISFRLPDALWVTLSALFAPLIAGLFGFILAVVFPWESKRNLINGFFWFMLGLGLMVGIRYAVPLLLHRLEYKQLKRGVLVSLILTLPMYFAVNYLVPGPIHNPNLPGLIVLPIFVFTLYIYAVMLRRSAGLLRWMEPEGALQQLRRRIHQPLAEKAIPDLEPAGRQAGKAISYAIHADSADKPLARFVEGVFRKDGLKRVTAKESPDHRIAILSNRSAASWTQEVTRAFAGKLIFLVASTIELNDSLTETGRLQWVDIRGGDPKDITSLARSLGDPDSWKRNAALETTPAMIDSWKAPGGITLLKRMIEIFGTFLLVSGLLPFAAILMEKLNGASSDVFHFEYYRSALLVFGGAACFWFVSKGIVNRKVAAPVVYGFLGGMALLYGLLGEVQIERTHILWLAPVFILPLLLYSALTSHFWLPTFARAHPDEVGIKKSIGLAFARRNVIVVSAWVGLFVVMAVWVILIS